VDFWYAFKYDNGWEYAYMDAEHKLEKGPGVMGDGSSPVDRTLDELYAASTDYSYVFWNDKPPNEHKVTGPRAHAKGVLAISKHGKGFWLTHSVPSFPKGAGTVKNSKSSFPGANAPRNGQSFFCMTIDSDTVPKLVEQFMLDYMVIYKAADHANLGGNFADWALEGAHVDQKDTEKTSKVQTVHSAGGQVFTSFAKSAAFGSDLYGDLVAPHYDRDFLAETWQNGAGKIPTWCKGSKHEYMVENVKQVTFLGHDFPETEDHSKWAVSDDGHILCVGDINRQEGQTKRGGGTVCITNVGLAKQIRNVISDEAACGTDNREMIV
jgi:deoxyribonuclease-2